MKNKFTDIIIISFILISLMLGGNITENEKYKLNKRIDNTICVKSPVKLEIYTFHHFISDDLSKPGYKILRPISVTSKYFSNFLKNLKTMENENKLYITNFEELHKFEINNCYPNENLKIITIDDGGADVYKNGFPIIKHYKVPVVLGLINSKIGKKTFMKEDEIKEMLNSKLIQIASHGFNHKKVSKLSDSELVNELCLSKVKLEEEFKTKVNTFIYPFGIDSSRGNKILKFCNYNYGATVVRNYRISNSISPKVNVSNLSILKRMVIRY